MCSRGDSTATADSQLQWPTANDAQTRGMYSSIAGDDEDASVDWSSGAEASTVDDGDATGGYRLLSRVVKVLAVPSMTASLYILATGMGSWSADLGMVVVWEGMEQRLNKLWSSWG